MSIPPYDAWALRRLLAGRTLEGELSDISPPFREIAEALSCYTLDARQGAWEEFLATRDDRDRLGQALAEADPDGAPSVAVAGESGVLRRFRMVRASDVVSRAVDWLWRPRVPRGMLSMFAGDPKLGKSIVTIATAAGVSRGDPLPGHGSPDGPGSVILLTAEEDTARTVVPRLKAAGADLHRVHILESVFLSNGAEALPSLRADLDAIESAAMSLDDCRLIVIDPVSAYLGEADDHRNAELRGVLTPLKLSAERTDVAVILVSHLNKSGGTNGKHRVTGSIAYVGTCRANFLFVRDRDDPTGRRVLMLDNGCNLTGHVPTLAYRIEDRGEGPVVEWEDGPVDITVEQALSAETDNPDDRTEARDCDRWLREALAAGPILHSEIVSAGRMAGFSLSALNRSKRRIGAKTDRDRFGPGSKCSWVLASHEPRHDPEPPIDSP